MHTLIVLEGPTAVGKTEISLSLAEILHCQIISADSRQFFKEMKIGTAAPTKEQLNKIQHFFIHQKSINEYYSAGQFELDVLKLLPELFNKNDNQIMVGGSMLYIDAVCNGLDDIPHSSKEAHNECENIYKEKGLKGLINKLIKIDPQYSTTVDLKNKQRIQHAIEVSLTINKPYSSILNKRNKNRDFETLKIGITMNREQLYERINKRVDIMIENGLIEEAKNLYKHKELNALKTVGYKELFNYFDGIWDLNYAINMIKQNTRHYAKRQMTWFRRDKNIKWFDFEERDTMINFVAEYVNNNNKEECLN